jgi:hypothetical protein
MHLVAGHQQSLGHIAAHTTQTNHPNFQNSSLLQSLPN